MALRALQALRVLYAVSPSPVGARSANEMQHRFTLANLITYMLILLDFLLLCLFIVVYQVMYPLLQLAGRVKGIVKLRRGFA